MRAQNQKYLVALLQTEFDKETAKFWLEEMDIRGVPCSPINTFPEVLNSDQIKSMDLVHSMTLPNNAQTKTTAYPIKMTDFDFEIYRSPPSLGAHNQEVKEEWLKMSKGIAQ